MKGPMALTLAKRLALTGICVVGATFVMGSASAWASTSGGGNGAAAGSSHGNHSAGGSPLSATSNQTTPASTPATVASPVTSAGAATTVTKASVVSAKSSSTTTPTVSFSGGHSAPTPYVPSAEPIYSPIKPATSSDSTSALSTSSGHPVVYQAAVSSLAFSGSDDGPLAIIGGLTVLSGLGLVALSRRTTA
jgi:hypothetical protein